MDFEFTIDGGDNTRDTLRRLRGIIELDDWFDQVEETGDGLKWRRKHPLVRTGHKRRLRDLAALELVPMGRELLVRGEFARVGRFLLWFIPGLGVLLGALFLLVFKMPVWVLGIVALALSPWIVLGPLLPRLARKRARLALERTLREAADTRDALARTAPPRVKQATAPIHVRGDIEAAAATAGDSGRAVAIFRNLVTHDFYLGHSTGSGFLAIKPWIGGKAGERLPFVGRVEVTGAGREIRVRADYSGIRFVRVSIVGFVLLVLHVAGYFMLTAPQARIWISLGLALSAPELIAMLCLPMVFRMVARRRLELLLKTAVKLAG